MEGHLNKEFTLAELEPGWTEESRDNRRKTSIRMQGSLNMSLLRVGRNPENSRKYVAGDPVNFVDWKAFARTDQLIVREQRDEASSLVTIVADLGRSMHWPPPEIGSGTITKAELSLRLGLWLAYTHLTMGDAVEVWLRRDQDLADMRWRPRSPADVMTLFQAVRNAVARDIPKFFQDTVWNNPHSDRMWILTDALEAWAVETTAQTSKAPRFLHTLSSMEYDISWVDEQTCYIERMPRRKDFMGHQLKAGAAYKEHLAAWMEGWSRNVRRWGGEYFLATDKTPVSMLVHFLHAGASLT